MHRLSSATRHSRSTSKTVHAINNNVQKNQAANKATAKATNCYINQNPLVFTRSQSMNSARPDQRGGLASQVFLRHTSGYTMHPERLRQMLREKAGQVLSDYYDSQTYKQKLTEAKENEDDEWQVIDRSDFNLNYRPMAYSAPLQPNSRVFFDDTADGNVLNPMPELTRNQIPKKPKKKKPEQADPNSKMEQLVSKMRNTEVKTFKRRTRKRTTIMPIYLKKIQENQMLKEKVQKAQQKSADDILKFRCQAPLMTTKKPITITKSEYKNETKKAGKNTREDNSLTVDVFNYNKLKDAERKRRWMKEKERRIGSAHKLNINLKNSKDGV